MSEWKECLLKEIADIQTGPFGSQLKNEQYITGGTPVVTVEHIQNFRISNFNYPSVTEEDRLRLSRYLLKTGDIVFTRVGSVDLNAWVKPSQNGWMFSSRMLRVRPVSEVDSRFLSYYFQQKSFREHILNISVGATMPSINTGILEGVQVAFPPLPEQRAIASVLSSLDDKIDLLHRQNKTLEAMAETLFRQWFVEEADEGWEEVALGDLVESINGVSYKGSELNPSDCALVSLKSFDRNGGFRLDGFKEYTGNYKKNQIVTQGDIAVAHTDITQDAAVIGNPVYIISDPRFKTMVVSMDLVKVEPKNEWLSKEFIYFLLRTKDFKQHCLGFSNGSTVLHLSKNAIPQYTFLIPPKQTIILFSKTVQPLFMKQIENIIQIRTLNKLRDKLLPKLMSGEVRVDYKKEAAGEY